MFMTLSAPDCMAVDRCPRLVAHDDVDVVDDFCDLAVSLRREIVAQVQRRETRSLEAALELSHCLPDLLSTQNQYNVDVTWNTSSN